jgi:hypothetical protein
MCEMAKRRPAAVDVQEPDHVINHARPWSVVVNPTGHRGHHPRSPRLPSYPKSRAIATRTARPRPRDPAPPIRSGRWLPRCTEPPRRGEARTVEPGRPTEPIDTASEVGAARCGRCGMATTRGGGSASRVGDGDVDLGEGWDWGAIPRLISSACLFLCSGWAPPFARVPLRSS